MAERVSAPARLQGVRKRPNSTCFGPYAVVVPCDFADPPRSDFAADALPLFVSKHQAAGVDTGPVATTWGGPDPGMEGCPP